MAHQGHSDDSIRDQVLSILSPTNPSSIRTHPRQLTCPHSLIWNAECEQNQCPHRHFQYALREGLTDLAAGLCSYMDLCASGTCRYVHLREYRTEMHAKSVVAQKFCPPKSTYVNADVRSIDFADPMFQDKAAAVLIDPPWDIHMELSYGTMTDDEMKNLRIDLIHKETGGFVFLWATTRTLETARECLYRWGYDRVEEIIWVKTNQLGGTTRSGRTGHWFNHSKEHCLVGVKGDVPWSKFGKYRVDCDVIVSPVRENSRKPDELYGIIERLVEESRLPCLELFGRKHNLRNNWITVGNQLD